MKSIGFNSGIRFDWHVLDVLAVFEKMQVETVELWGAPPHADLTSGRLIRRLGEMQRNSCFDIVAVHPPARGKWNITAKKEKERLGAINLLKKIMDNLLQIGVEKIVLHPGEHRGSSAAEDKELLVRSADSIERLLEHIGNRSQKLCVENTLPHHVGGRLDDLLWLEKNVTGEFYITFDTSHASLGKTPPVEYIEAFGKKIRHTHLSDNRGGEDDHWPPGEGNVNFPEVLRKLAEKSYLDYWMLEVLRSPGIDRLEELLEHTRNKFNQLVKKTFQRPHGRRSSRA
ncbi:MAG: sugar phosphate isomerase/epimerase family protein [bacterium]